LDDPAQRLLLARAILQRFFRWVWVAVLLLPATGFWMTTRLYDGFSWPLFIWIMAVMAIVMILLFLHVYFAPWQRLNNALDKGDTAKAPAALETIRRIVTVNLILGMIVAVVASAGRYL
ncbi:MAG TPA: CopD family protein, partial [Gammaproteobacteria bacterium]|nr:CopD family protein [Gammaproteobacteria bacterium]